MDGMGNDPLDGGDSIYLNVTWFFGVLHVGKSLIFYGFHVGKYIIHIHTRILQEPVRTF